MVTDNELDIHKIGKVLWKKKLWIFSTALFFFFITLIYTLVVRQVWHSTAITDYPTIGQLGKYYEQEKFLAVLDTSEEGTEQTAQTDPIREQAYMEFIRQLNSYDTRRQFWLQSDYYKSRCSGVAGKDAVLLDKLINSIKYTPADPVKKVMANIMLSAETPQAANQLLRDYLSFANKRAAAHLNNELKEAWLARREVLGLQLARQEMVAKARYQRVKQEVEQALKIARQNGISSTKVQQQVLANATDDSRFLYGTQFLQARLEALESSGPHYDDDYQKKKAQLTLLEQMTPSGENFKAFRYLRTPEEPIRRDSPRRGLLLVIWSVTGLIIGAVIALLRSGSQR